MSARGLDTTWDDTQTEQLEACKQQRGLRAGRSSHQANHVNLTSSELVAHPLQHLLQARELLPSMLQQHGMGPDWPLVQQISYNVRCGHLARARLLHLPWSLGLLGRPL